MFHYDVALRLASYKRGGIVYENTFCTGGSEKSENAIRVTAPVARQLEADATVLSVGPSHDSISKVLGAEFRMSEVTIDTHRAVTKNISK